MRIVKISFKNINSFRGEHHIDFSQEPLKETGIFAIIGPTGSGKSTILDALTLALFNQIPRFDKKISKTDVEQMGSVLTHFTNEGYAMVEYVSKGNQFRSRWSISRANTGNLRDYEMEVSNALSGEIIESQKGKVPGLNEQLIGLSYDQFNKSILLSQGEFSRFLKANKNDRAKLLEDITGTHVYSKIGAAVYNKAKGVKAALHISKMKLDGIEILSEDDKKLITGKINGIDALILEQIKLIEKVSANISIKTTFEELQQQKTENRKLLDQLEFDKSKFETSSHQLAQHELVLPLQSEIIRFQDLSKTLEGKKREVNEVAVRIDNFQNQMNMAFEKLSKWVDHNAGENNYLELIADFVKKVTTCDEEMNRLIVKGKETRSRIQRSSENNTSEISKILGSKEIDPDKALSIIDERQKSKIQGLNNRNRQSILTEQNELLLKLKAFENALRLLELRDEVSENHGRVKAILESTTKEIKENNNNLKNLLTTVNETKQYILKLRKEKEEEYAKYRLEDYRKNLIPGNPCPLCGSIEHPYSSHILISIGEKDVALANHEGKLVAINKNVESYQRTISAAEETVKFRTAELEKLERELKLNAENLATLYQQFTISENSNIIQIQKEIELFNKQKIALEAAVLWEEERVYLEQIKPEFEETKEILLAYRSAQQKRMDLYQGENVQTEAQAMQSEIMSAKEGYASNKLLLSSLNEEIKKLEDLHSASSDTVLKKLKKIGFHDLEEATKVMLSEEEYRQLKSTQESLSARTIKVTADHERLDVAFNMIDPSKIPNENLEVLKVKLSELESKKDKLNEEKGGLQNRIDHNKQSETKQQNMIAALKQQESEAEKWLVLDQYIGDSTGSKFSNFAQDLTLSNLIALANNRLKKLSDRYILDKPGDDSEMRVIDTYQGNTSRGIKTLSGGETFLISLSMALSLSDLASKNVPLDSLFIDEGFGTLDQETLDVALSTLESLQSESNKTIGVISHVEALKERINTQIRLHKDAQGFSSISISNENEFK